MEAAIGAARTVEDEDRAAAASILSISNLSKNFGGVRALDRVDLSVAPGEVHGLLGQNGSGKSTLIKILSGFYDPDPGAQLWIEGREVGFPVTSAALRKHGVSFVHQNLGLVASLTVLENLMAYDLAANDSWAINWRAETQRARELFERNHIDLDPLVTVSRLSPVERAQLAIVRAFDWLRRKRRAEGASGLLVLDEPTPFLPAYDVDALFRLVRDIIRDGTSVIFVSHDIDEVLEITSRATVLRDGRVAGTFQTAAMNKQAIIQMIVGEHVDLESMRPPSKTLGGRAAAIRNLQGETIRIFSAEFSRGEVVGLTGLIGSGYDEIVYAMFGAVRAVAGTLELGDRTIELAGLTPRDAIEAGCILIPGNRQESGAVATLSVSDNVNLVVLGQVSRSWALAKSKLAENAALLAGRFNVRPRDPSLLFGALSGGNQQKALLAKWFQMSPRLVLLDEPTQGVDVGARAQVFSAITSAAEEGATVLCASSDYEQLTAICDRVLVFSRGVVVDEILGNQISKSAIAEACYRSA
ncbi:MAG: sugar ABC transporter ATP-binding protein [Xanthobacteraceae bacterium]